MPNRNLIKSKLYISKLIMIVTISQIVAIICKADHKITQLKNFIQTIDMYEFDYYRSKFVCKMSCFFTIYKIISDVKFCDYFIGDLP